MRLYGGRLINSSVRRAVTERAELRDAVVYDVDTTNRYCRVKIQGSNTYIKAYYNENWGGAPEWVKPGNAVRITHPGGNKGRIEVVGHGILLPTAIPGGSVTPAPTTPGDTILTGCVLSCANPASMSASVSTGTYRIDGVTYTVGALYLGDADIFFGRADIFFGGSGASVTLDAASATYFRYDAIVVGDDGTVDVVKGSNASGEPTMPTTPADHVRIGWVLLYPGMTEITQADINRTYSGPIVSAMPVVVADDTLEWGIGQPTPDEMSTTITVSMRDQYGRVMTYSGYELTITFSRGNGTLSYDGHSSTTSLTFTFSGTATITYTRDADSGESSPLFLIDESYSGQSGGCHIMLYDDEGGLAI
jgi:hypothetical protein